MMQGTMNIKFKKKKKICFCVLPHKPHDFWKEKLLIEIYVLRLSVQLLFEVFLIIGRIRPDIIINVHRSLCKVPVILVRF